MACLHLCGNRPLTAGPYSRHSFGEAPLTQARVKTLGPMEETLSGERVPGAVGSNRLRRTFLHVTAIEH